jgi:1,4-dihydroxy-6-naphthoate synthase
MQPLTLAYSPCPNDTFIFGAIAEQRIAVAPFQFDIQLADIQELNAIARKGQADIVKVSFLAYLFLQQIYELLPCGSALGKGCGPLLIARPGFDPAKIEQARVGIPGLDTTAHFLLHYYNPNIQNKKVLRFDTIIPALLNETIDLGLIIHESRFIYPSYGLALVADLGAHWERTTHFPIPLGGIIIKKALPQEVKIAFTRLLSQSIDYAFENPTTLKPYIQSLAQELGEDVINAHIQLYVNEYTRNLGEEGLASLAYMEKIVKELNFKKFFSGS